MHITRAKRDKPEPRLPADRYTVTLSGIADPVILEPIMVHGTRYVRIAPCSTSPFLDAYQAVAAYLKEHQYIEKLVIPPHRRKIDIPMILMRNDLVILIVGTTEHIENILEVDNVLPLTYRFRFGDVIGQRARTCPESTSKKLGHIVAARTPHHHVHHGV